MRVVPDLWSQNRTFQANLRHSELTTGGGNFIGSDCRRRKRTCQSRDEVGCDCRALIFRRRGCCVAADDRSGACRQSFNVCRGVGTWSLSLSRRISERDGYTFGVRLHIG